jgi:hypothetical protein
VTPTRHRIRSAQKLIAEARGRTTQSAQLMLESANRILIFQLHSPDLVLDTWTLYQRIVTPSYSAGGRPSPTT